MPLRLISIDLFSNKSLTISGFCFSTAKINVVVWKKKKINAIIILNEIVVFNKLILNCI